MHLQQVLKQNCQNIIFDMLLLGKEKSLQRTSTPSKDKSKGVVKVASSSKIPKDFFRSQSSEKNKNFANQGQAKRCMQFQFTFMDPLGKKEPAKQLKKLRLCPSKKVLNDSRMTASSKIILDRSLHSS